MVLQRLPQSPFNWEQPSQGKIRDWIFIEYMSDVIYDKDGGIEVS